MKLLDLIFCVIWTFLKWMWRTATRVQRVYARAMRHVFGESWRTTMLGILAVLIGLRSAWLVWIPYQTVYFNLFYVETGPLALILVGWALLHARDHKTS